MKLKKYTTLSVALILGILSSGLSADTVTTDDHREHDFDNSDLGPFVEDQGFSGSEISKEGMSFTNDQRGGARLKLHWKESEYDGSRRERGHEVKGEVYDNKEIFCGYYLSIPSGQSNDIFKANTIIWQLYNWNTDGCSNWTAHIELVGNDLYLTYRGACVTGTTVKIYDDLAPNVDHAIQIRAKASGNNDGLFEVRINGKRAKKIKKINFGFGEFNSKDEMETSVIGVKMGLYCYETSEYTNGETRILYLDNLSVSTRNGTVSNTWNEIDPDEMD